MTRIASVARISRIALLASFVAACAGAPRSTSPAGLSNQGPASDRFTVQPLKMFGPEGLHSASHTFTTVTGALELTGDRAALRLELEDTRSPVGCPKAWREGKVHVLQACVAEDAEPSTSRQVLAFTGAVRRDAGKLRTTLRHEHDRMVLACDQVPAGLSCAFEPGTTMFQEHGPLRMPPTHLEFSTVASR